ncbi:cyanophycin synthetase [Anaerospora hongkongensis]|uniref:Cyanophycin synthetase n=2 Tax=Anaerospora hongkongensis TaxID=244830 RepID=A0A4R1PY65_9FIRM|nr:cyanophycin synthetase [Anaerospora hongkongensis]TCL33275.1 cyanophycin synthetase [Anaerospora hongkongensis]
MNILSTRIIEGPNVHSYHPIVRVKLDIGKYEDIPTNEIAGFTERITDLLPGLKEHQCSRGYPGGFLERLIEGTYLAHVFEHVAIELQCMAGYEVSFGKARGSGSPGVYDVVISFRNKGAAQQAVLQADQVLKAVLDKQPIDIKAVITAIKQAGDQNELGPSTAAIYRAAKEKGIPVMRVGDENLLILGYGSKQKRIWATTTSQTGALATDLACDKGLTNKILTDGCIPVPYGMVVTSAEQAKEALREISKPVAVKPLTGNQGKGVTLEITSAVQAERAYQVASEYDKNVIVEQFITGRQYRFCVVNGKVEAVAERIPAYVVGDGKRTVKELVDIVNSDPNRGVGHEKPLTRITIDAVAITVLAKQDCHPQSIPEAGKVVYIRENANLSTGGTAVDVTDIVHPANKQLIERATRLIGLDVAGVDVVAEDITQPIREGTGAVIEINAAPGIRMHHYPSAGKPRNVAGAIIDSLFPDDSTGRIPLVAITGTNGKTTVTRMIGHIWQTAGRRVGMTTTDGIYIDGCCVREGDTTGPASARTVLTDPAVEVAVLETARGGIVRAGLAFDKCDVGIVTNITEDHLGQDGIEDLEGLARVKSLIIETVRPDGFSLLNADDRYVTALASRARGEIVYFSIEPDNIIIRRHLGVGGRAFFVRDNVIYTAKGREAQVIAAVDDIPITLGGIAQHNLQNAMIAAAACYCMKVPPAFIYRGLSTFAENPGRLTVLPVRDFRVCIDYGHNPAGYQALVNTVKRMGASRLVGVIAAPGDRRDDVVVNVGRIAGRGFDHIYVKEDDDLRGRKPGEVSKLLYKGVLEAGLASERIQMVLPEKEAVYAALANAHAGDLIVVFYEKYGDVFQTIQQFCQQCQEQAIETIPAAAVGTGELLVGGVNAV